MDLEHSFHPLEDIQREVKVIDEVQGDFEAAHGREDRLHQEVLAHIAAHAPQPWCLLAREALKTMVLPFARYGA